VSQVVSGFADVLECNNVTNIKERCVVDIQYQPLREALRLHKRIRLK
jgi:hypothetical protein